MKESKEKMRSEVSKKLIDIAHSNQLSQKVDLDSKEMTQKLVKGGANRYQTQTIEIEDFEDEEG